MARKKTDPERIHPRTLANTLNAYLGDVAALTRAREALASRA